MPKRDKPLKGNGNDAVDYREAIVAILAGGVTALTETTRNAGTRPLSVEVFVEDPTGEVVMGDGRRGRMEQRTIQERVRKLTKLELDETGQVARDQATKQT